MLFALRQLMRRTRSSLVLRWVLDGFSRRSEPGARTTGSAQPHGLHRRHREPGLDDAGLLDRHVWVGAGDGEPAWAAGGSYQAVRVIRMLVEFWDRTPLAEQEAIMGRHKDTGAPLGRERRDRRPDYADDPEGERIPLDAHIRLANPRTPASDAACCCGGASRTRAASTARAGSTRAWPSSPTSAA